VAARKDDAPADVYAVFVNVTVSLFIPVGGGLTHPIGRIDPAGEAGHGAL